MRRFVAPEEMDTRAVWPHLGRSFGRLLPLPPGVWHEYDRWERYEVQASIAARGIYGGGTFF